MCWNRPLVLDRVADAATATVSAMNASVSGL
jgi:hypothetical protein